MAKGAEMLKRPTVATTSVPPKPRTPWIALLVRAKQRSVARMSLSASIALLMKSRYDKLGQEELQDGPSPKTIIDSASAVAAIDPSLPIVSELAQLRNVKVNPPPIPAVPQIGQSQTKRTSKHISSDSNSAAGFSFEGGSTHIKRFSCSIR
ncbi:hypothetical protein CCR75_002559 [Bremia lactucae]|uniref:Uncharacterized protein n=1 Tax=Bremia lactucae TaxID=4779 RepID=A0A976IFI0_BRELC|nr:hypothetical protein CCR75_002563 [Bremia lactucae]TDH69570.1 hypothetical protein CCR75_002559 [Bremia lactucae]